MARGRRAGDRGYATLVMPDTVGATLSPLPALGVLAGATRTLRLGTYVVANDYRNPVLLARELATLDVLSGGRLEPGLGAGRPGADEDYRRLGIAYESGRVRVVDRFAESLRLVKAPLAGESADASGPPLLRGRGRGLSEAGPPAAHPGRGVRAAPARAGRARGGHRGAGRAAGRGRGGAADADRDAETGGVRALSLALS